MRTIGSIGGALLGFLFLLTFATLVKAEDGPPIPPPPVENAEALLSNLEQEASIVKIQSSQFQQWAREARNRPLSDPSSSVLQQQRETRAQDYEQIAQERTKTVEQMYERMRNIRDSMANYNRQVEQIRTSWKQQQEAQARAQAGAQTQPQPEPAGTVESSPPPPPPPAEVAQNPLPETAPDATQDCASSQGLRSFQGGSAGLSATGGNLAALQNTLERCSPENLPLPSFNYSPPGLGYAVGRPAGRIFQEESSAKTTGVNALFGSGSAQ